MESISKIVSFFDPISFKEIKGASLLNRVDTKYLISPEVLKKCLIAHIDNYYVVEVNERMDPFYSTMYFDTIGLDMYYAHHNGKSQRHKVRYRHYDASGDIFLEVKTKIKNRTIKERLKVKDPKVPISDGLESLVHDCTPYRAEELSEKMSTKFNRITLVSKAACERITIDYNISFKCCDSGKELKLPNCIILEVKRDKAEVYSEFARCLKQNHVMPLSLSKYCLGTVVLNPKVKYNRFKPRLRKVEGLMGERQKEFAKVG